MFACGTSFLFERQLSMGGDFQSIFVCITGRAQGEECLSVTVNNVASNASFASTEYSSHEE